MRRPGDYHGQCDSGTFFRVLGDLFRGRGSCCVQRSLPVVFQCLYSLCGDPLEADVREP
jgi:hypothetical protein